MAQRPRISQLKRTNIKHRTFEEQYHELESETQHVRTPVLLKGELPMTGNRPGSQCLVISEGVLYYWDQGMQNWRSALGRAFDLPEKGFRRYKRKYVAIEGQTDVVVDFLFTMGADEVDVYINGILQDVDVDYIEADNKTIQFTTPLSEGMQVTIATPMMVEESLSASSIQKRLEELEHNHYQLMMNQYYTGKPVDAHGVIYDGFLNTNFIDYALTTINVIYDNIRKSIGLTPSVIRQLTEQFDNSNKIDLSSSINVANSEMTLPISADYSFAIHDDFSTQDYLDIDNTSAYHDIEHGIITTVDTYAGGDSYYKGDFMAATTSVDRIGFDQSFRIPDTHYSSDSTIEIRGSSCYGVLAMGDLMGVITELTMLSCSSWPYTTTDYFYANGDRFNYRTDGSVRTSYSSGGTYYYKRGSVLPTDDGNNSRSTVTYVAALNKIYSLQQTPEVAGRYYQKLYKADGKTGNLGWSSCPRPIGMPPDVFGSDTTTFTGSTTYIDQIGATYDRLILRIGDILYFLDSSMKVVKLLDWSNAERKPSMYNVLSRQMTADKRYLYFPARLLRDGEWGYYLEVFEIEDGSFIGEILVTTQNAGIPATTAMGFDHQYKKLILGISSSQWYIPMNKIANNVHVITSYAGFMVFEKPNSLVRDIYSKPVYTNLPKISYKLVVDQTLNNGTIEYFIQLGNDVWTRINPDQEYTWSNPNGAKETSIRIRATLKTNPSASTAPVLTEWRLDVKQFEQTGLYQSIEQLIDIENITGGKLISSQDIPNETSLKWSIQLDQNDEPTPISQNGTFSLDNLTGDALAVVRGRLDTNNTLYSPVVRDYQLQLHQVDAGRLVTETFTQIEDINKASVWITTGTSHEYYTVSVSRDGGATWVKASKENVVKQPDGNVESLWKATFKDSTNERRQFKMKIEMTGVTEIHQYGAMLD